MKKLAAFLLAFALPTFALAQSTTQIDGLQVIDNAIVYVNRITYFLVAAAILVFIYGIVKYIIAGNEEGKAKAQQIILYGVIGLFAIVAVWGLVNFLVNTTGVQQDVAPALPCPPGFSNC